MTSHIANNNIDLNLNILLQRRSYYIQYFNIYISIFNERNHNNGFDGWNMIFVILVQTLSITYPYDYMLVALQECHWYYFIRQQANTETDLLSIVLPYIYITYRYDFNDKRNDMLLLMVICDMKLCRQDMM